MSTPRPKGTLVRWRHGWELDRTPITFLVEDMIPKGMFGAIGGKDGRGKTLLAMEIAKCVLTGEKLFGTFAVQQGNVYLMLLDDPEFLVSDRLDAMGILNHPNLHVATRDDVDWNNPRGILTLLSTQLVALKPTFTVIDALYLFVPTGGGTDQANSSGAMGPIMQALDEIANTTKSTVMVVAHDNKAGSDIAGSRVVRQMLKWILRLILPKEFEDDPEGGVETMERILQLNKVKTGRPTSWALELQGAGKWVFHGNSTQHRVESLSARILHRLADTGDCTVPELAESLQAREQSVRETCAGLLKAGKVVQGERPRVDGKPGRGAVTYGLPTPAPEPPAGSPSAPGDPPDPLTHGTGGIGLGANYGRNRSGGQVLKNEGMSEKKKLFLPKYAEGGKAIPPEPCMGGQKSYSSGLLNGPIDYEELARAERDLAASRRRRKR